MSPQPIAYLNSYAITADGVLLTASPQPPPPPPRIVTTPAEAEEVIAGVDLSRFPFEMTATLDPYRVIALRGRVAERDRGDMVPLFVGKVITLPTAASKLVRLVRDLAREMVLHELDERIMVGGTRVFDPHFDQSYWHVAAPPSDLDLDRALAGQPRPSRLVSFTTTIWGLEWSVPDPKPAAATAKALLAPLDAIASVAKAAGDNLTALAAVYGIERGKPVKPTLVRKVPRERPHPSKGRACWPGALARDGRRATAAGAQREAARRVPGRKAASR